MVVCSVVLFSTTACADKNKPIQVNELPAKAQTVLTTHFSGQKVTMATLESEIIDKSYNVVLQNGTKLEFDRKGNLTEVDCKQGTVPAKLIPQAIKSYVQTNYSGQNIKKMEIDKNEHEIELSNGLTSPSTNASRLLTSTDLHRWPMHLSHSIERSTHH